MRTTVKGDGEDSPDAEEDDEEPEGNVGRSEGEKKHFKSFLGTGT
jgi:hypothetical protein